MGRGHAAADFLPFAERVDLFRTAGRTAGAAMIPLPEIGRTSAGRLAALRAALDRVIAQGLPDTAALARAARDRADATTAAISFVGQVKAGKSSLVNALSGIGPLLPTAVNPWTAVLTNLHFGHPGRVPETALFRFFGRDDWDRMLAGGDDNRRLAETFLPGFRSDILAGQLREMEQNARSRLGDMFDQLFGREHHADRVTTDILNRYVSAGYGTDGGDDPAAGRFSALTRSAEIFLGPGPFRVPVTLSDTPGINDPFLLRDEITTASLRDADVFVVTLSAHQTLGPPDLALLRLLVHLGGRRIVVFVNRVDELDDPAAEMPRLLGALENRLAREFGDGMPVVIAGSARWGELAFGDAAETVAADPRCCALAAARGPGDGVPPDRLLLDLSGLPRLAAALDTLIDRVRFVPALAAATQDAMQGLGQLVTVLETRLARDGAATAGPGDIAALARQELALAEDRLTALDDLDRALGQLADDVRGQLRAIAPRTAEAAMRAIRLDVDRFVEEQVAAHAAACAAGRPPDVWHFGTEAVRQRAERHAVETFRAGRTELDERLRDALRQLDALLDPLLGPPDDPGEPEALPNFRILPGARPEVAPGEVVLTRDPGWRIWRDRSLDRAAAAERIGRAVRASLTPGLQDVQKAVGRALAGRAAAAADRLAGRIAGARTRIEAERAALRTEAQALIGDIDADAADRLRAGRQRRAEALRARIAALAAARQMLGPGLREPSPDDASPQPVFLCTRALP